MKGIIYFCNGLGNFIMQMPAMEAVARLSGKPIDICTSDNWRDSRRQCVVDICRAWPVVDKLLSWSSSNGFNESNYGFWFYSAHGMNDCGVVPIFLKNMKSIVPRLSWRKSLMHETDHYMEIAYGLGYRGPIPKVEFPLAEKPVLDLPRPIIGFCNGWFRTERMYWQKKGWPHFKELSDTMRHYFGASIVGIGGSNEIPQDVRLDIDYQGKLSILESAKAISQFDLFVTTDTGPMHLANVLDVPLIAIFGPTLTTKNGPRGKNSSVMISGEKCAPCQDTTRFYNCKKFVCMENIKVGDIMARAKEKIK